MSFIKITTFHPDGREVSGITQQVHVTAQEAFDSRVARLRAAPSQGHEVDKTALTINLHPTEVIEYSQLLEYAETIDGFDQGQPGLFEAATP